MQIVREPVWLAGGLLQALGWILQAAALNRGSLVVVQSLTTMSLVVALPLGVRLTDQHVGPREVIAAGIAGTAGLGRRCQGARGAALFGSAAGICYGLQAAVTRVFVGELGHGVAGLLASSTT